MLLIGVEQLCGGTPGDGLVLGVLEALSSVPRIDKADLAHLTVMLSMLAGLRQRRFRHVKGGLGFAC